MKNEKGIALFIILVVLLGISVLGATSLQNSVIQQKMTLSGQVRALSFDAAETALAGVAEEATGGSLESGNVIFDALSLGPQDRCVGDDGVASTDCVNVRLSVGDRSDIRSNSTTEFLPANLPVDVAGSTGLQYIFLRSTATGQVGPDALPLARVQNVQEFGVKVPKSSISGVYEF